MTGSSNKVMSAGEWSLLVLLSVLWGGSFFLAEVALAELPPFTVVLGRVGLAAVALVLLARISGQRMPASARTWGAFLVMGFLNNAVPFSLIVWGQTQIASGLASILNATTPVFVVILAHVLTRDERMTGNRLVGVLAGLAGVTVMIGPELLAGLGANVLAQLAVLGAAVSYAFAGIYGRRFHGLLRLRDRGSAVSANPVGGRGAHWTYRRIARHPFCPLPSTLA